MGGKSEWFRKRNTTPDEDKRKQDKVKSLLDQVPVDYYDPEDEYWEEEEDTGD
ncbi:MAG: hypothetical protein KAS32_16995 [Candidatus Peribacteraceae bacterium]|nr:hypothetical protein [Candidatus Peribacteraceae bacterium]